MGATATTTRKLDLRLVRTAAYYLGFIVLGLFTASTGPTVQGLARHTGTELGEISVIFSMGSVGYLLGSLLAGRLYDRLPGHRLMGGMVLVMMVLGAVIPTIPVLWVLAAIFVLMGTAQAMLDVGANTLVVWNHGDKVGPFMNGLHFFFGVGAFISPVIAGWAIGASGDINWAYWTLSLAALPAGLWLLSLPSPKGPSDAERGARPEVNVLLLALVVAFFVLYVGAEISFGNWIFTYATQSGAVAEQSAYLLNSVFWGALTVGRLAAIPVAAALKPRTILMANLAGALLGLVIILLFPGFSAAIWVGAGLVGLSMASCFPTMVSYAERRMTITGAVTSWFFVGASTGGMILPWLIGQLFETVGPRGMMAAVFIDLLLEVGVLAALVVYSRRLGLED
ncbi:MAG: MFS transporter [Anaerolineae bacterium]|nr:MFS transporter [Anaerolineae bacterium]